MTAYRLSCLTALMTFVLITIGGTVHATGSSLACPDWPLCFGQVFPEMKGGVLYEHTHRLVAGAVVLITLALAWRIWKEHPSLRRLAVAAVALLLVQAVLGGITVILRLSILISSVHLAISLAFLGIAVYFAFRTRPVAGASAPLGATGAERRWLEAALGAMYAQSVLGGVVRHTGAGFACQTDLLFCAGEPLPTWGAGILQMVHRAAAVGVAVVVVAAVRPLLRGRARPAAGRVRSTAWVILGVVVAQIGLGLASVATLLTPWAVTAHLAGAALLVVLLLWLVLEAREPAAPPPSTATTA